MNRINILSVVVLLSSFLRAQQAPIAFRSLPYLQNISNNAVTIISVANKSCLTYVLYGDSVALQRKAYASHHGQIDAGLPVQKIRINGLTPGQKYFYRVVSKEILLYQPYKIVYGDSVMSPVYSFSLPFSSISTFSFLAFNDVHSKPGYISEVCKRFPTASFVCYNGDVIDDIEREDDIVQSLSNASSCAFAHSIPFVYTRGNHETRGSLSRLLSAYVDTPKGEYYYSFVWGNTCFVLLDTGEDKPDTHPVYAGLADYDAYREHQLTWLKTVFASRSWKRATHRIVCGHIPASIQNDGWHASSILAEKFVPVLNKAHVDLYIAGHTHKPLLEIPDKNHKYALVIGGGPMYERNGDTTTFIKVDIDNKTLRVTLCKIDGTVLAQYNIKK